MKKFYVFLVILIFMIFNIQIVYAEKQNNDFLDIFSYAAETCDQVLIKEVLKAIMEQENSNEIVLISLAKYSEKGKIEYALHNAIKSRDLVSSIYLSYYSKNIKASIPVEKIVENGLSREGKNPIELAVEFDLKSLVPYLIMKGADPYRFRKVQFLCESEEDTSYFDIFFNAPGLIVDKKTQKKFYIFNDYKRTLVADVILMNRLDILKMLSKMKVDLNKVCLLSYDFSLKPLNLALAARKYEIAQFLLDQGVNIE